MRRNRWIAIAAAAAVVLVAVIVILAFTLTDDEPRRTAVVVEEEPQQERATEPARPAERGAGEQPSGQPETTTEPAAPQETKPAPTTGPQEQPQAEQPKQPAPKPAAPPTVQEQLNTITSGKNPRPAMVEFGAEWCPPCKRMKPIVEELEKQYNGKVDIVYVDVDKHPELAEKYNISAIPVQVFYNKQGKQLERHEGFYSKEDIVKQFQQMGIKTQ